MYLGISNCTSPPTTAVSQSPTQPYRYTPSSAPRSPARPPQFTCKSSRNSAPTMTTTQNQPYPYPSSLLPRVFPPFHHHRHPTPPQPPQSTPPRPNPRSSTFSPPSPNAPTSTRTPYPTPTPKPKDQQQQSRRCSSGPISPDSGPRFHQGRRRCRLPCLAAGVGSRPRMWGIISRRTGMCGTLGRAREGCRVAEEIRGRWGMGRGVCERGGKMMMVMMMRGEALTGKRRNGGGQNER